MSAPEQLAMFEPSGEVLATLAKRHLEDAERAYRVADAYSVRGFTATAHAHWRLAVLAEQQAQVCEMALQFETLGGVDA